MRWALARSGPASPAALPLLMKRLPSGVVATLQIRFPGLAQRRSATTGAPGPGDAGGSAVSRWSDHCGSSVARQSTRSRNVGDRHCYAYIPPSIP